MNRDLPATLTVKQTSKLIGLSVRATYRAVEAGHIDVIRFGRRIVVPTAPLLHLLGMTDAGGITPHQATDGDADAGSSHNGNDASAPNGGGHGR